MTHDNDTIRRIVNQLDRDIATLEILARQATTPEGQHQMTMLMDAARLYRFRLKELGHAGRFDNLEGDTP